MKASTADQFKMKQVKAGDGVDYTVKLHAPLSSLDVMKKLKILGVRSLLLGKDVFTGNGSVNDLCEISSIEEVQVVKLAVSGVPKK